MAEHPYPDKTESTWKSVQELAISGKEVPARFCYADEVKGAKDALLSALEIPVIDIGLLASPSTGGREEQEKLHSALSTCGCLMVCQSDKSWNAKFVFGDLTFSFQASFCTSNGREAEICADIIHEYSKQLKLITEVVLKAMARSLNLEENCFLDKYGEQGTMVARFNFFPPCPRPDLVLGLKEHAKGTGITVVLQDKEVEGLQLLKDDQWFRVPVNPEALLISIGDQTKILSNALCKSLVQRVVTNSERGRISSAMICAPDPENDIEPVDGLESGTRPRLYKKVKNYDSTYFQYCQLGMRPIEAVRI